MRKIPFSRQKCYILLLKKESKYGCIWNELGLSVQVFIKMGPEFLMILFSLFLSVFQRS
jgi:hypothetical protein